MFFLISKLIENLLLPSNAIAFVAFIGVALFLLRMKRAGITLMMIASLSLLVFGWSPAGNAALLLLEDRFPRPATLPDEITGIVVLGGEINTHISAERSTAALNDAGERLTSTAELARRFPDARIILSGGIGHLLQGHGKTESAYARNILLGVGVPAERIELEERSRNTCENATESRKLAHPAANDTWLLVTSANHMPRAVACFRAAGFRVIAYPVDYRTRPSDLWRPNKSIAEGLSATDLATHEWLGLAAYSMFKGTEFFPSNQDRR